VRITTCLGCLRLCVKQVAPSHLQHVPLLLGPWGVLTQAQLARVLLLPPCGEWVLRRCWPRARRLLQAGTRQPPLPAEVHWRIHDGLLLLLGEGYACSACRRGGCSVRAAPQQAIERLLVAQGLHAAWPWLLRLLLRRLRLRLLLQLLLRLAPAAAAQLVRRGAFAQQVARHPQRWLLLPLLLLL
jgi:hypothetical protein